MAGTATVTNTAASIAANPTPLGIAATVGSNFAGAVSGLVSKALGHSQRVARKSEQTTAASSIGVSYECVRQFDAGVAAGLSSFAPCQGGADTRCKTAAGADCDFNKVADFRKVAHAAVNVNNTGTTPDPSFRALNPAAPAQSGGQVVQGVAGTTPNTVTKANPYVPGAGVQTAGIGGNSSLGIIAAIIGAVVLMFAAFAGRK